MWPYPLILPDTISYHGGTYFKLPGGCQSRRWWHDNAGAGDAVNARRSFGTLPSAIGVGGAAEYSFYKHAFNGYVLVSSGKCLYTDITDLVISGNISIESA